MLVAIEGIDGAGKGTLTRQLLALAAAAGVDAASLSFPRYDETRFAKLIGQYLRGEFGQLDEVPPRFAALLFAGDRFESREHLMSLMARHRLVLLDRYVASNMAYNAAKLPPAERAALIDWIEATEFGLFELPAPDLTCLVETGTETADRLVGGKGRRSYTAADRDLHEADRGYMARVAEVYGELAAADRGSKWFRCRTQDADGALRPPDAIAAEAWTRIHAAL
jgi:dTMP kinase